MVRYRRYRLSYLIGFLGSIPTSVLDQHNTFSIPFEYNSFAGHTLRCDTSEPFRRAIEFKDRCSGYRCVESIFGAGRASANAFVPRYRIALRSIVGGCFFPRVSNRRSFWTKRIKQYSVGRGNRAKTISDKRPPSQEFPYTEGRFSPCPVRHNFRRNVVIRVSLKRTHFYGFARSV